MSEKPPRAGEDDLAALHGAYARHLAARLASGEVTAAELNNIRQFLKDNGIDCVGRENPDINDITKNLPTYADDDADGDRILN